LLDPKFPEILDKTKEIPPGIFFEMKDHAYFDCNATTPVLTSAAEAAWRAMEKLYGNPSSVHLEGIQARDLLETTRALAAQAVGAHPSEIIFTSGATEGIQTSIFSVLLSVKNSLGRSEKSQDSLPYKLLYSATEHKAVPTALKYWVKVLSLPFETVEIPVDNLGQIQQSMLRQELKDALLLCSMFINNETGVIQNIELVEKNSKRNEE
jgi:cysteine sulfinate desulfinase/cysteine desulfurase-like protein